MLATELFNLKPGTFIKGLKVKGNPSLAGRVASYRCDNWINDKAADHIDRIHVPFYQDMEFNLKPFSSSELASISKLPLSKDPLSGDTDEQFFSWDDMEFLKLPKGDPVGVLLGHHFIFPHFKNKTAKNDKARLIYSKFLVGDGRIGWIVATTDDILSTELELL